MSFKSYYDLPIVEYLRQFNRLDKLSYWTIDMFETCPKKYEMIAEKRIRGKPRDARFALEGTALHTVVERCLQARHDPEWMLENYQTAIDEAIDGAEIIRWRESEESDKVKLVTAVRAMTWWMVDYLKKADLSKKVTLIEKPFNVEVIPGLILSGRPDVWLVDEATEESDIWDLKAVSDESRVNDLQLLIYGLAVMSITSSLVRSSRFVMPLLKKDAIRDFKDADYRGALDRIIDVWNKIKVCRSTEFKPTPCWACKWCGVKEHCSGYVVRESSGYVPI